MKSYALSFLLGSMLFTLSGCGSSSDSKSDSTDIVNTGNSQSISETSSQSGNSTQASNNNGNIKINTKPVASGDSIALEQGKDYSGKLQAHDSDNDNLTYTITSKPKNGTISISSNGNYKYTPNKDFAGDDSFEYQVSDKSASSSATVHLSVVAPKKESLPPRAPSDIKVVSASKDSIVVSWKDNSDNEDVYEIYVNGEWAKSVPANTTTTTINGLKPASTYKCTVSAKNQVSTVDAKAINISTDTPPVISINGDEEVTVVLGDHYTDKGATAHDKEDGKVAVRVYGLKDIDTNKEGSYTISYWANDKDNAYDHKTRTVNVVPVSLEDRSYIPYDSNLELGQKGFVYYVDPRPEENGLNRAIEIDTVSWTFRDLNVSGINPHSLDRAGDSNKFYVRTQNSYSFDVIDFDTGSVKTIPMGKHKPRAIGATNLKHHLQLISVKNRPVIDVIDTTTDKIIATLGDNKDYDKSKLTSNAGAGSATGHSFWLDSDHFALIDRVNDKIVVWKVIDNGGAKSFKKTSELATKTAIHSVERIVNPTTKADLVTFYETGEGDLTKGIDPYVQEVIFDPKSGKIKNGRETILVSASKTKVDGKNPSTHHLRITPDKKYIYAPTFDHKLHIIDRATMKVVKVLKAGFGAAHVTFSEPLHLAVITNHFDKFITIVDTNTNKVVKEIKITDHKFHGHLLQPHFSYVSEDGKYYFTFDTQDGDFLKINLETLEIEDKLHVGGAPEQAHS
jgi:hypothetical protein